jgi:hypothetical protein
MVPVTVTIRIPNGGDGDLLDNAERRLSRAPGIQATVASIVGIEPRLSATVVTVAAVIERNGPRTDAPLRERLAEVAGLESIDGIG